MTELSIPSLCTKLGQVSTWLVWIPFPHKILCRKNVIDQRTHDYVATFSSRQTQLSTDWVHIPTLCKSLLHLVLKQTSTATLVPQVHAGVHLCIRCGTSEPDQRQLSGNCWLQGSVLCVHGWAVYQHLWGLCMYCGVCACVCGGDLV